MLHPPGAAHLPPSTLPGAAFPPQSHTKQNSPKNRSCEEVVSSLWHSGLFSKTSSTSFLSPSPSLRTVQRQQDRDWDWGVPRNRAQGPSPAPGHGAGHPSITFGSVAHPSCGPTTQLCHLGPQSGPWSCWSDAGGWDPLCWSPAGLRGCTSTPGAWLSHHSPLSQLSTR